MNKTKIYPLADHILFFDGCSKGNPGEAGIGAVIYDKNGSEIWSYSGYIGKATNNESEYRALIVGLTQAIKNNINSLIVFGDSQLVIKQVNGEYDVKAINLIEFHSTVLRIKKNFEYIEFNHILRTKNKKADQLANIGLKNKSNLEDQPFTYNHFVYDNQYEYIGSEFKQSDI